ncbi:MAG: hypothetical protein U0936_25100 [Planctomycetaceae bacterium]
MKLEKLPLWKRMAVGYVVVGILVLICGAAGGGGIYSLGRLLTRLSGPAWSTADGAMNAISIQGTDYFQLRDHSQRRCRTQ